MLKRFDHGDESNVQRVTCQSIAKSYDRSKRGAPSKSFFEAWQKWPKQYAAQSQTGYRKRPTATGKLTAGSAINGSAGYVAIERVTGALLPELFHRHWHGDPPGAHVTK